MIHIDDDRMLPYIFQRNLKIPPIFVLFRRFGYSATLTIMNLRIMIYSGGYRGEIRPWPPSKLAMEFAPLGGRKSNDSKKGHQKFWEIDEIFGNADIFFGKRLKKSFKNVGKNLHPRAVSEVLDPLVMLYTYWTPM